MTGTPRRRPRLVFELLVVLCLLRVYDLVRGHAEVRRDSALDDGEGLLHLERTLHLDVEGAASRWTSSHALLNDLAAHYYQYAHVTVALTVLAWCWWCRPESYRWARTSLVIVNLIGLVTFFVVPVAPPRLLPGSGVVDGLALAGYHEVGVGPVSADQYGAMPSLHLAWAVWVTVVLLATVRRRPVRVAAVAYPFLTALVVVVTGNHYVLDVVAGVATALVAVAHRRAARAVSSRRPRRAPASGSSPRSPAPARPAPERTVMPAAVTPPGSGSAPLHLR